MNWFTFFGLLGCTVFISFLIIYYIDYKETHKHG